MIYNRLKLLVLKFFDGHCEEHLDIGLHECTCMIQRPIQPEMVNKETLDHKAVRSEGIAKSFLYHSKKDILVAQMLVQNSTVICEMHSQEIFDALHESNRTFFLASKTITKLKQNWNDQST